MPKYEIIDAQSINMEDIQTGMVSFGPGLAEHLASHNLIEDISYSRDLKIVSQELTRLLRDYTNGTGQSVFRALLSGSMSDAEIAGFTGREFNEVEACLPALERSGIITSYIESSFIIFSLSADEPK